MLNFCPQYRISPCPTVRFGSTFSVLLNVPMEMSFFPPLQSTISWRHYSYLAVEKSCWPNLLFSSGSKQCQVHIWCSINKFLHIIMRLHLKYELMIALLLHNKLDLLSTTFNIYISRMPTPVSKVKI